MHKKIHVDLPEATVVFDVEYKFIPGEKPVVRYFDGSGYPGSPPEVKIIDINAEAYDENGESIIVPNIMSYFPEDFEQDIISDTCGLDIPDDDFTFG